MWLVRMFVHITVWKLYFGWSNPHFLSQFSVEPAHSSSSVPHCPFSLHSLSFCGLLPLPSPLSPSPSAGPLLTLPVSRGRMRPAYPSPAPHFRMFLFFFLGCFFSPSVSSEQSNTLIFPEGQSKIFITPSAVIFTVNLSTIWSVF